MHFRHKKRNHEADAAAQESQEAASGCPHRLVCKFHGNDVDVQLNCRMERIEEVAIPEVATGVVEQCDDLGQDACSIFYDTAVPEIHMQSLLRCPAAKSSSDN